METRLQRKTVRYSISFRQLVVREVEQGNSIYFVQKKYGIKGSTTVQKWIIAYGKQHLLNKIVRIETMDERNKLKELEQENKRLKLALADAFLAKDCLEGVIEMANEEYKTDLKKNFGRQSVVASKTSIR